MKTIWRYLRWAFYRQWATVWLDANGEAWPGQAARFERNLDRIRRGQL